MPTITLEEIHSDCRAKGIEILAIEETKFGFNQSISAIKLTTSDNVTVLMPRYKLSEIKIYQNNIFPFQKEENFQYKPHDPNAVEPEFDYQFPEKKPNYSKKTKRPKKRL